MKKRVLLISSWTNSTNVMGYYLSPPMGLYRMQHWLRDKHDVSVLDPNVEDPVQYLERCDHFDVIGFSPTKDNLHNDFALMRYARQLFPKTVLIAGGVEATCNYQNILDQRVVDYCVMGEGEKALEYFLEERVDIPLSPSVIAKRFSYETVLTSEELARATHVDFNKLHIPEYWERNAEVTGMDTVSTNCVNLYITNYCPHGCKFCSTTHFIRQACPTGADVVTIQPAFLIKTIQKIMNELPATKTIYFHDDNACYHRDTTMAWCKLAIQEGIKVSYVASSRINHFDEELLVVMKEAGFRKLSCGIEAYSDTLLKKIRKGQTTKHIDNFVAMSERSGMPLHMNLILCQPEADIDEVKRTAEFALRVLERNKQNTVTAEPFIKAYAGSWYFDNWDLIEYRYSTIPSIKGTRPGTIRIPHRFLPRDPQVRRVLDSIDEAYRSHEFFVNTRKKSYLTSQLTEELCKVVLNSN